MSLLSIIIPAYNEQESIAYAVKKVSEALQSEHIGFEIIFVDDGSKDDTYKQILDLAALQNNIHGISFSRNFGKESAIIAGLSEAKGDCCVVMDCDMQHPAHLIPTMYRLWQQGYQIIEGVKSNRGKESISYKFFSKVFYRIISWLSGLDMKDSSDFKLLDRDVVNAILSLPEKHVFFRGLTFWVGYHTTKIEYEVEPRMYGTTKWSGFKLMKYAVKNITSFSSAPLQIVTSMGILLLCGSFVLGIQTIVRLIMGNSLGGFTTVILLLLIIGGFIMISLGVIGHYVAKIYDEVKNRPKYIIAKKTDNN